MSDNASSLWARLGALYSLVPGSDNNEYVVKNRAWVVKSSGGGSLLTPADFKAQISDGALGYQGNNLYFSHPSIGALAYNGGYSRDGGGDDTLNMQWFPWLSTTAITGRILRDGPILCVCNGTGAGVSKVSAIDYRLLLTTGTTATGSAFVSLGTDGNGAGWLGSTPVSGEAMCAFEFTVLSVAAQTYTFSLSLCLPGYINMLVTYTHSINSGRFQLVYNNNLGVSQTFNTTITVAISTKYIFSYRMDATNIYVYYRIGSGAETLLLTVARSAYESQPTNNCLVEVNFQKSVGTTASTLRLGSMYAEANLV